MIRNVSIMVFCLFSVSFASLPDGEQNMVFSNLAASWDEAIPLGNGMLGALVWQDDKILRFSLDRADLWDQRPVENFKKPEFTFSWLYKQIEKGDMKAVQDLIDVPYDRDPAPTKIPAGRLEIDQSSFGKVKSVNLDIGKALCTIEWDKGIQLKTFIHATKPLGCFILKNLSTPVQPVIVAPPFSGEQNPQKKGDSLSGHELKSLGYPSPQMETATDSITYTQQGWGGFTFIIHCRWKHTNSNTLVGVWTIQSNNGAANPTETAKAEVNEAFSNSFEKNLEDHEQWWKTYWDQSSITIPDEIIESQWYREQYKFGSASRRGAPPITLQAVWTADNRQVPPWKGDFHHDLNTELSYWPCYSANHLEEGLAFLDWLWKNKPVFETYTKKFYGSPGIAVPGITTIGGEQMGGWSQYSCSATTSAWLAQHFYLHWRYSQDQQFLKERAYPWIRETAIFLKNHSVVDKNGKRSLLLSASPEINDNRIDAWFRHTTNYDLALIRWLFKTAAELAGTLKLLEEAENWQKILQEWPGFAKDKDDNRLLVAPSYPLKESHRHFSHLMAIHPLGLIDKSHGEKDSQTIDNSLKELDRLGPDWWCGYSYAWQGNMEARAFHGEKSGGGLADICAMLLFN